MSIKDVQGEGSDQNWMIVEGTREGWWSWISTFLAGVIYEWPLKIILVIKIIQKHWLNTKSVTKILKIFSKLYYLASRLTAFRAALCLFINSTFFSHSFIYCICICACYFYVTSYESYMLTLFPTWVRPVILIFHIQVTTWWYSNFVKTIFRFSRKAFPLTFL